MATTTQLRRAVASSYLGSVIEYYDFLLYATASAVVFNKVFFSSLDPLVGTIASFGTSPPATWPARSAVSLFGHYGDLLGRKRMLVLTMTPDGRGELPDRPAAHLRPGRRLAPVGLVLLRVVQGISVGGEWGGAVLMSAEHATTGDAGCGRASPTRARRAAWCSPRRADRDRALVGERGVPGLGLADPVPAQPGAAGDRPVRPHEGRGDARSSRPTGPSARPLR